MMTLKYYRKRSPPNLLAQMEIANNRAHCRLPVVVSPGRMPRRHVVETAPLPLSPLRCNGYDMYVVRVMRARYWSTL